MRLRSLSFVAFAALASVHMLGCSSSESSAASAPAADLPGVGEHVSQKVTASGGTVKATGGSVTIPAGALGADATITIDVKSRAGQPSADTIASNVYEFGPSQTFLAPVSLTLDFDAAGGPAGATAKLAFLDGTTWKTLDDSKVSGSTVTATTTHFTPFSVVWVAGQGQTAGGCANVPFTACGGDPTGTWSFAGACVDLPAGASPFGQGCTGATGSSTVDVSGTFTFGGGSYNFDEKLALSGVSSVPKTCQGYSTCPNYSADGGGGVSVQVTDDGTNCVFKYDNPSATTTQTGTYRISGTDLYLTQTGKAEGNPDTFCVEGNQLKIKTTDAKSGTFIIVLSK